MLSEMTALYREYARKSPPPCERTHMCEWEGERGRKEMGSWRSIGRIWNTRPAKCGEREGGREKQAEREGERKRERRGYCKSLPRGALAKWGWEVLRWTVLLMDGLAMRDAASIGYCDDWFIASFCTKKLFHFLSEYKACTLTKISFGQKDGNNIFIFIL